MKQRLVQTLEQGDNTFGQVSNPDDLMKGQGYAHERISDLTHDFVNNTRDTEVQGFAYELTEGNELAIEIMRPGRVYAKAGESYELLDDEELTFDPAHETLPRLDLVVAKLEDEVPAELDLIPFTRLRTIEEFEAEAPPYAPQNINAATELHWRAVPMIKTGVAAAVPAIPAFASNEVPLYLVSIGPGATTVLAADIVDLRETAWNIRRLNELVGQSRIDIQNLLLRMIRVEQLAGQPIDLGPIWGELSTLGEILQELLRRTNASNDLPEIKYDRPKYALTDPRSSKINADGFFDVGAHLPYLDLEVGGRVNFGDTEHAVEPRNFVDQTLNPQYVSVAGGGDEHVQRNVNLTLASVTQIGTNGFIDFVERAANIAPARTRAAAAARDERYVEIFGGLASDNASALGDWQTYDLVNDTITPRAFTSGPPVPNARRPALFPYGDGTHVLLIAGDDSTTTPNAYKINASTGAVTAIAGDKPEGDLFVGDLVSVGKIIVVASQKDGDWAPTFWEFDTGTDSFTELGVTGSQPTAVPLDFAGACFYKENQLVIQTFDPGIAASGRTYIFDRISLQCVEFAIPQPYIDGAQRQLPISGFRMANVNGRPLLIGGDLFKEGEKELARVWELAVPAKTLEQTKPFVPAIAWTYFDASFARTNFPAFCSTLAGDDLPHAKAFFFGGYSTLKAATSQIYASVESGLISVIYNGVEGISLGGGAKSAQFEVDPFTAAWDVAGYMASLHGRFTSSNIRLEVSLNDGDDWHDLKNGITREITDSDDPGVRRLRITLYSTPSAQPILTRLTEVLDGDGDPLEERVVLRIDRRGDGKDVMYMYRDGRITFEADLLPSTPERCLILQTDYDPDTAPGATSFINRRRPIYKVTGTAGPSTENVRCELAVPVRFVEASGVTDGTGVLYRATIDPEADFLADTVELTGVADGDVYEVLFAG